MPDHVRIQDVMDTIRRLHVGTEADEALREQIDRLLRRNEEGDLLPEPVRVGRTAETRGILFVDAAGAGKTTAVSRALEKHPALGGADGEATAFLAATVPTEPTLKAMAIKLLQEADYPNRSSGAKLERTRRTSFQLFDHLRELMDRNGQIVLWIDEAHDLMARDPEQILRAVKSLMQDDKSVIVILSGTERLGELIRSDPQVQRRFTIVAPDPLSVATDRERLLDILDHYCERTSLGRIEDETVVPRLLVAARDRFGRAIEMMQGAVEQAMMEEADTLDLWHFALAWGMREGTDRETNPFVVDDWARIDPDAQPEEPVVKKKRTRRKK
ncbi:TniB family NTP-binding protein [Jannaschia aquimarina]|uniref:AAA+ ATPase domain-containing protein n=1 Tax=Jannaschia aquimarina TaxID=935700 RepID=A0A0D1D6I1_9RHOB|nr:TniB family NTP-binding protein [Jannaschia aquimarina]KIT15593.1 hypothetical protein jaqu_26900 [Jannaschia aquimarina]SNT27421.1 TniB protein [Jannaschia aquimarina]